MTLQVAMIGSDGWLIASDRRLYQDWTLAPYGRGVLLSPTRKIEWRPDVGIAYGFSGDSVAKNTGDSLIESVRQLGGGALQPDGRMKILQQIGNHRWREETQNTMPMMSILRRLLIVFFCTM